MVLRHSVNTKKETKQPLIQLKKTERMRPANSSIQITRMAHKFVLGDNTNL